jgi:ribosomal protein RSM22 (predicted rRNA methylase)
VKKEETKWYEKASGKKIHKEENILKLKEKSAARKSRKEAASKDTESGPAKNSASKKNTAKPVRRNFTNHKSSEPMFDDANIPKDAAKILEDFGKIVLDTRKMSGKQKVLLPSQIKKLSHQLTDERNTRRIGYMNDASFVSAYISYFMWWNLVRLTKLFSNLPSNAFELKDGDICLDIGSGPLTVPLALWLSRPELRSKKLTFYVMDLSQTALAAGEEIFLSVAAKTIKNNEEPWKIIRVKGALGTGIKEKASLVTSANVFNELAQSSEMQSDYLAKVWSGDLEKYFDKDSSSAQTVLIIEPGDPKSARLVSLMRDALIRRGFMPLSPCPHMHSCPMEGRTSSNPSGKWCNFAFDTSNCPEELLRLSEKANLSKERAVLSFILAAKNKTAKTEDKENKKSLSLRVASDFIKLPELHKSAYYCCSEIGLVLAIDKTNRRPENGDLLTVKMPEKPENLMKDKKSGALIIDI